MSIRDYRSQLEEQVAQESAVDESESVTELLAMPTASEASPESRAEALGRLVRAQNAQDPGTAHVEPLERLADPDEAPSVRLAALGLLKLLAISSPTYPEWRPLYLEALRRALSEPELRLAALEVLTQEQDRHAQERLLEGLREPERALVPPDQALRLLSNEPHADVRGVAREIASAPPDEETQLQALKILASDPGSVEGFQSLLADSAQSLPVRKLAATALNHLAPELLQPAEQPLQAAAEEAVTGDESALAKHIGALVRTRP